MGDLDAKKSLEIDRLVKELSEKKAKIELLEFRMETGSLLDEMREVRDDFRKLFQGAVKILSEEDRSRWEKAIAEALKNGSP